MMEIFSLFTKKFQKYNKKLLWDQVKIYAEMVRKK